MKIQRDKNMKKVKTKRQNGQYKKMKRVKAPSLPLDFLGQESQPLSLLQAVQGLHGDLLGSDSEAVVREGRSTWPERGPGLCGEPAQSHEGHLLQ